jgi:hypothetical protein
MGSQVSFVMGPARSSSGEPVVVALMDPVTAIDLSAGACFDAERSSARLLCESQSYLRSFDVLLLGTAHVPFDTRPEKVAIIVDVYSTVKNWCSNMNHLKCNCQPT